MTYLKLRRLAREFFTFVPPYVGVASLVAMKALGLLGLRSLGQSWTVSAAGALGGAVLTTTLLYVFLCFAASPALAIVGIGIIAAALTW